jgi:5'-3' exonuclease
MLSLALSTVPDRKIYVLRDDIFNPRVFFFVAVHEIADSLRLTYTPNSIITDFIVLCMVIGNDFLAQQPLLDVHSGGLDAIWKVYSKHFISSSGITDPKTARIDFPALGSFLRAFTEEYPNSDWLQKKYSKRADYFPDLLIEKYGTDIDQYRDAYYAKHIGTGDISKMAADYLYGLQFVTDYYLHRIPAWDWTYAHLYAPFLTDIASACDMFKMPAYPKTAPIDCFLQLLCVLPPHSAGLLPVCMRKLVTDPNSPLREWFPTSVEADISGKRYEWESVILVPIIDLDMVQPYYRTLKTQLSVDETARLRMVPIVYSYRRFAGACPYNSRYGRIAQCQVERRPI